MIKFLNISVSSLFEGLCDLSLASVVCRMDTYVQSRVRIRPSIADAARVLEIDEEEVVKILSSSGCLSERQLYWVSDRSAMSLDKRAVECLKKYNRKKLKKYYNSASRASMSMSGEEKRTFDNFVKLYTRGSKTKSKHSIDQNKIDQAFLRELFYSQENHIQYTMEPSESAVLGEVRNSIYYHVNVNETTEYDFISGILPECIRTMVALRYYIFTSEDDSDVYSSLEFINIY